MAKLQFPPDRVQADNEAESRIAQIVDEVANNPEGRFLLTKAGDPSVVIVNVKYIETLLGDNTTPPTALPPQLEPQIAPPPGLPSAPVPSVTDFMAQPSVQPLPPQEVEQRPPTEPPAATDFRPLISPLDGGQPPVNLGPAAQPPPGPPNSPPPIQAPGTPLMPPPPLPPAPPLNGPPPGSPPNPNPFLGGQQ